jgi:hypothetical protein
MENEIYRACILLVSHFEQCMNRVEQGMVSGFHSRLFSHFLHPEVSFIFAGKSQAVVGGEKSHLEHIVPCAVLFHECCRLIKAEIPHADIAHLLSNHWKVAYISKTEADFLDSKSGLNLKHRMPSGWSFQTGDTFARFQLAGIKLLTEEPLGLSSPPPA